MHIRAIGSFAVAGVALVGWHKRMTVLKIIKLSCFEDQMCGTQFLVILFDPIPFMLVAAEAKNLQFDTDATMEFCFGIRQMLQTLECLVQTATYAVYGIRLLGEAVYGNDDAIELALDKGFCYVAGERLGIGGDDGI